MMLLFNVGAAALLVPLPLAMSVAAAAAAAVVGEYLWNTLDGAAAERPFESEEHTSELQSLMRISYAVFCLKKKNTENKKIKTETHNTQTQEKQTKHTQYISRQTIQK